MSNLTSDAQLAGPTTTDFQAWVADGEARGTIVIDGRHFTVTPDLAYGFMALLMEIDRLNDLLADRLGTDAPSGPALVPLPPREAIAGVHEDGDALVIDGIRYSRDLFRDLAFLPIGERVEIIARLNGTVALRRLPGPVEIVGEAV